MQLHHANRKAWESVRREVYSSLAAARKSTNVVVGATFLPGTSLKVQCFASTAPQVCRLIFAADNFRSGPACRSQGEGFTAFQPDLRHTGERAKLLRQAWETRLEGRIPSPVPLLYPYRIQPAVIPLKNLVIPNGAESLVRNLMSLRYPEI